MKEGFVYLDAVLPGVLWDAKYATADNFTGAVVAGYQANRIVGTCELAAALADVTSLAAKGGYRLLLWDAYRPQRAVDCFLRWANAPEDGKTKARHYPNIEKQDIVSQGYVIAKSAHSRGSAVDLTLCAGEGNQMIEMAGGFDLMDIRSHHSARGLPPAATENRKILREMMEKCGFNAYEQEWWHYTLKQEPYANHYFDFPVA